MADGVVSGCCPDVGVAKEAVFGAAALQLVQVGGAAELDIQLEVAIGDQRLNFRVHAGAI